MSKRSKNTPAPSADKSSELAPHTKVTFEHLVYIGLVVLLVATALVRIAQTRVAWGYEPVRATVVKVETVDYVNKKVSAVVGQKVYLVQDADFNWKAEAGAQFSGYLMDQHLYSQQVNVLNASPLTLVWNVLLGLDAIAGVVVMVMYMLRVRARRRAERAGRA